MRIYEHLLRTWLGIQEGDIVWATASPGWQKWIWSPFLSNTWQWGNWFCLSREI